MAARLKLAAQGVALGLVAGLFALLVWKLATEESGAASDLARGKTPPAPGFTLPRLDGPGRVSLSSFRGQAVVLNFWASWCVPCKDEAPVLEAAWRRHRGRGLVVLGIDVQDLKSDARPVARKHGLTYPLVRDGPGKTMTRYGVTAVPETFFVNREGKLVGERLQGGVHLEANRERFEGYLELALRS